MSTKGSNAIADALERALVGFPTGASANVRSQGLAALRRLLTWRGSVEGPLALDECVAYREHLESGGVRYSARSEFRALLPAVSALWGPAAAAPFSRARRDVCCAPKPTRRTEWDHARIAIEGLPETWRDPFLDQLACSQNPARHYRMDFEPWSAAYLENVARSLRRWHTFCHASACSTVPSGTSLHAFGMALQQEACTLATAAQYVDRVHSAFVFLLLPGFASRGCRFVVDHWHGLAVREGATTKTASGIVPASEIYDLGFELIDEARARPIHNLETGVLYRNGLILAVAAVLPQRARALAALDTATTFRPVERPLIEVNLPGKVLKTREGRKRQKFFSRTLRNEVLWDALEEYLLIYRPLFDDGTSLFPSSRSQEAGISTDYLGRLVGDITERRLGVRVSIHRVRDCVATESTERIRGGSYMAPALLDHSNPTTSDRHYIRAKGVVAAEAFAEHLARRQSSRPQLPV